MSRGSAKLNIVSTEKWRPFDINNIVRLLHNLIYVYTFHKLGNQPANIFPTSVTGEVGPLEVIKHGLFLYLLGGLKRSVSNT